MKYVLEFGVKGGQHCDNIVVPTHKLGAQMASNLVRIFTNKQEGSMTHPANWWTMPGKFGQPRTTWESKTHFVALSKLDGVPRGSASATLWKKKG